MYHISKEARIEPSTHCNYNCIFCPRDEMTRLKESMTMDSYLKILDKLQNYPHIELITLSGYGEPFMDQTLIDKVQAAKDRGYQVHIVTTGSLLDEEKLDRLIKTEIDEMRFSFYSNYPGTYAKVHSKNLYDKCKNNILYLLENRTNTKVIVEYLVLEDNRDEYEDWKTYWIDKADVVEAWNPHNWADLHYAYRTLDLDNRRSCGRPFSGPYQIQVDGTMNVCCFDYDNQLIIGNILTDSLEDIFSSPRMNYIREKHKANEYSGLVCDVCDQLQPHDNALVFTNAMDYEKRVNSTSSGLDALR